MESVTAGQILSQLEIAMDISDYLRTTGVPITQTAACLVIDHLASACRLLHAVQDLSISSTGEVASPAVLEQMIQLHQGGDGIHQAATPTASTSLSAEEVDLVKQTCPFCGKKFCKVCFGNHLDDKSVNSCYAAFGKFGTADHWATAITKYLKIKNSNLKFAVEKEEKSPSGKKGKIVCTTYSDGSQRKRVYQQLSDTSISPKIQRKV